MNPNHQLALLVDFGSTYTKLVAVDLDAQKIVARSQALTTISDGINTGMRQALSQLETEHGLQADRFSLRLACSSAAGGLRVIAIGLVKSLTVEAARQAALGAGARLIDAYGDHLTPEEVEQITAARPDMILLAGGIDGGDRKAIQHNAAQLAGAPIKSPIVIAGNKAAAQAAAAILNEQGKECHITENVLPHLKEINVEPAREVIRQLYMERIVHAKGLDRAESFIGKVVMPTPAAVLRAAQLLAEGTTENPGWESVMVIDIGGATTDVHSVAPDPPRAGPIIRHGLPEAHAKRTVEGDLGLRVSALSLLETAGLASIRTRMNIEPDETETPDDLREAIQRRGDDVSFTPDDAFNLAVDEAMACLCSEIGTDRHVGRLREHYLPTGFCYIQDGKDLTQVEHLIGTGGIFVHTAHPKRIMSYALFEQRKPDRLKPIAPRLHLDQNYAFWAMGLLAETHPDIALYILRHELPEM